MKHTFIVILVMCAGILQGMSQNALWLSAWKPSGNSQELRIQPTKAFTFASSFDDVKHILLSAPDEGAVQGLVVSIPTPDGAPVSFEIWKYDMAEDALLEAFPGIGTYFGRGVDNKAMLVRLDHTYHGWHAQVLGPGGTWHIDPLYNGDVSHYQSYYKNDLQNPHASDWECNAVTEFSVPNEEPHVLTLTPNGSQLKTYRLALACTGEYAQFHGGTVNSVLSEMTTAMNRVNGIYEREVAVRMILIGNNNLLVYLNANTDPYTNNNGSTMLGQNQNNVTSVIGSANYDIGHVFSTGGGGIAQLGCVCSNNNKARGVTGLPNPVGDPFYVDYVCHEMGHQFNANHTFNSSNGSCGGGNRSNSNAYEPGSGSTIMAYAGICAPDNVQNFSDDYFHVRSYRSIVAFITSGNGNNCDAPITTNNAIPTVTAPNNGFSIPLSTPFRLTAVGNDADNDPMTYCWEQFDRGSSVALASNPTSGQHPLFRSFSPDTSPTRVFPRMQNIVTNTNTNVEKLPYYARTMTFYVSVRDNKPNGGGTSYDTVRFNVAGNSGPFLVLSPNTNLTFQEGTTHTVTWDVANSNASPVNCSHVNILLSVDGGYTYPYTLISNTPNDGSEQITWPVLGSTVTTCRVMVEAVSNIFFDISNTNFVIQPAPLQEPEADFNASQTTICEGATVNFTDNTTNTPNNWSWSFPGGTPSASTVQNPTGIIYNTAGTYTVQLIASNSAGSDTVTATITVHPRPTATFTTTPASNGMNNGTATVIPAGGAPPYTYLWTTSPIQTTQTAINLFAGNNTVTVTDANGCSATFVVVVPGNVGLEEEVFGTLKVFPNPASDVVFATWTQPGLEEVRLELLDVQGRVIYTDAHYRSSQPVSMASQAAGVYLLRLYAENIQVTLRVIKD